MKSSVSPELNRREFLRLGAFAALGAGCSSANSVSPSYSVAVLGDVHYDAPEIGVYHAYYKPKAGSVGAKIFQLRMRREHDQWSGLMQRLSAAARRDIRPDTKFVLQLGDLIQGNCAKAAVHARMLEDGFDYFKKTVSPDLPFVPIVGNHDVDGGVWLDKKPVHEVYRETMLPKLSRELGQAVGDPTFAFRQGSDLFLCVDFNYPDFRRILDLLEDNSDVRYTFIVSHGAVVPVCGGPHYRWFLFGRKRDTAARRKLYAELCRRRAIALVGHNHQTVFSDFAAPDGRITQFMATSVWEAERQATSKPKHTTPAEYAKFPKKAKNYSADDARALFGEYRPHLTRFFHSGQQGRYRLDVSDAAVTMTMYGGDADEPSRTFTLRGEAAEVA